MAVRISRSTTTYRALSEAPACEAPEPSRNAAVTTAVIERPAPRRNAAELSFHFSLVARKTALRTCGPAIITNDIGNRVTKPTSAMVTDRCGSVDGAGTHIARSSASDGLEPATSGVTGRRSARRVFLQ